MPHAPATTPRSVRPGAARSVNTRPTPAPAPVIARRLLSFFDVRGLVPRPLKITMEPTILTGETVTTVYKHSPASLTDHEIDHSDGLLYTALES
ncbi:peptide deformylase [Streptomyces massasporeus]|uniref:peptide deformylase n=1 Tax=Streptomyces massasporeus TaxID=67324 RepID=UPI0036B6AF0A